MHEEQINAVHAEVGKVISSSSKNSCVVGVSVGDAGGGQATQLGADKYWMNVTPRKRRVAVLLERGCNMVNRGGIP